MKFNDKITKILHFIQAITTKKFFTTFIDERKPIYWQLFGSPTTERHEFQKIVYHFNKNIAR